MDSLSRKIPGATLQDKVDYLNTHKEVDSDLGNRTYEGRDKILYS